jgi:type IV secretory pathway VirB2 component (pilin)
MNLIDHARAAINFGKFDFFKNQPTGTGTNLITVVNNVIDLILYVAGVLAIIYLIYSGILYITAAGNPDSAKKGQQGIINAVIGIVIIMLAWVIVRAVASYSTSITYPLKSFYQTILFHRDHTLTLRFSRKFSDAGFL